MIKCEKCGNAINHIITYCFDKRGIERAYEIPIYHKHLFPSEETEVVIETGPHWCGYELDENGQRHYIQCPFCHDYPFDNTNIFVDDKVEITMHRAKDPFRISTEENGLLIPTEVTNRLINKINNGTLADDHETLYAIEMRTKGVCEHNYRWTGDPEFDKLACEVNSIWYRLDSISQDEYTPEYLMSIGRLLACIQMLQHFLSINKIGQ